MSRPGKYFFYHSSKIENKLIISKHMLEAGLLIDAFYTPKDTGDKTKIQAGRRYIALVLHPRWGTPVRYMHAIVLDNLPGPTFNKFAENVGLVYSERFKRIKKINVPEFDMDKDEAQQFYKKELRIKIKSEQAFKDCYRTFLYDNFTRIFAINYKFNKPALATIPKATIPRIK